MITIGFIILKPLSSRLFEPELIVIPKNWYNAPFHQLINLMKIKDKDNLLTFKIRILIFVRIESIISTKKMALSPSNTMGGCIFITFLSVYQC